MNFQGLGKIETADKYMDQAYGQGRKAILLSREDIKLGRRVDKERKSQRLENIRVQTIGKELCGVLNRILKSYPRFKDFDPFYKELAYATLNMDAIKIALATVKWGIDRIEYLTREHSKQIKVAPLEKVNKIRTAYLGRVSSIMKRIDPKLKVLDEGRMLLKKFPTIKTGMSTLVIAGFPNVGKSSVLRSLTGSDPEINSYPFTTKQLMLGYIKEGDRKIQVIDSPGILDRPLGKLNSIEHQAVLAIQHLADVVLYIADLSETCGYTVKDQEQLLTEIIRDFKAPVIVVCNKSDLPIVEQFKGKYNIMSVSTTKETGLSELRQVVLTTMPIPDKKEPNKDVEVPQDMSFGDDESDVILDDDF